MTRSTKVPEHKRLQGRESENLSAPAISRSNSAPTDTHTKASVWPFSMDDSTPLAWWRLLPPDLLRHAELVTVRNTLNEIAVLRGGEDFGPALRGDADAAIRVALAVMPIIETNLQVDIAMTTLLGAALEPNAAPALVMAQVLGLTDLGHPFGTELAASWLDFGRRHSTDLQKFGEAEVILRAAFRERQDHGETPDPGIDAPAE